MAGSGHGTGAARQGRRSAVSELHVDQTFILLMTFLLYAPSAAVFEIVATTRRQTPQRCPVQGRRGAINNRTTPMQVTNSSVLSRHEGKGRARSQSDGGSHWELKRIIGLVVNSR